MGEVITIGVDIAKSVFQIHVVDADGTVLIRRRVSRASRWMAKLCCKVWSDTRLLISASCADLRWLP